MVMKWNNILIFTTEIIVMKTLSVHIKKKIKLKSQNYEKEI